MIWGDFTILHRWNNCYVNVKLWLLKVTMNMTDIGERKNNEKQEVYNNIEIFAYCIEEGGFF